MPRSKPILTTTMLLYKAEREAAAKPARNRQKAKVRHRGKA